MRRLDSARKTLKSPLAGTIAIFTMAVLFALLAFGAADRDEKLGAGAPTAQAVVVDRTFTGRDSEIIIEFTTSDGRHVRTSTDEYLGMPEIGDTLTVRYSPEDPAYYVREVGAYSRLYLPFYSLSAAGFSVAGLLALRRSRRSMPRA